MSDTDPVFAFSQLQIRHVCALIAAVIALIGAAPPSARGATHVVRAGETVNSIATDHGTTPVAIVRANRIANADVLRIGQRLNVPGGGPRAASASASPSQRTVTVRRGDTLGVIAARSGTTARAIAEANGIVNPDTIRVGAQLRLPSGGASAPSASPPARGGGHVVRAGDTLSSIARRSRISVAQLARANGMRTTDVLAIGRRLVIPGGASSAPSSAASATAGTYRVHAGDTLGVIAARLGVTVDALAAANGLHDPNVIAIGQRLRVPARGASVLPTPARAATTPVTAATAGWGRHLDAGAIRALIGQSAARYGVDPALVRAIAWQESGWWQGARSSAGAIGVMQLMPDTATWVGPALVGRRIDATNARDNIDGGAAYVAWLLRNTSSRDQAVASYYQGLGSVRRRGLYDDTRTYVRSVNSHYGRR